MPIRNNNDGNRGSDTSAPSTGQSVDGNGIYAQAPDDDEIGAGDSAGGAEDASELFDPTGYFDDGFVFVLAALLCFSLFFLMAGIATMNSLQNRHEFKPLPFIVRFLIVVLSGLLGFGSLVMCLYSFFNSQCIHYAPLQSGIVGLNIILHDIAMHTGAALMHLGEMSSVFRLLTLLFSMGAPPLIVFVLFLVILFWFFFAFEILRTPEQNKGSSDVGSRAVKSRKRRRGPLEMLFLVVSTVMFFLMPLLFLLYANVYEIERYSALAQEYERRIAEIEAAEAAEEAEWEAERSRIREADSSSMSSDASSEEQAALQRRAESGFVKNAVPWSEAASYVGQYATFEGVCVDMGGTSFEGGSVTFADLGVAYPDPSRLTIVIWSEDVMADPNSGLGMLELESMLLGNTIQISGYVYMYDGVANIELSQPSQIRVDSDYYREYFTSAGTYIYASAS